MSAVADVLNGAADLIEREGWVQGHYYTPAGRCIDGALSAVGANRSTKTICQTWHYLSKVTGSHSTISGTTPPGRTKAEVVAALRAAAEKAS